MYIDWHYIEFYWHITWNINLNNASFAVQERGEGFVLSAKHGAVLCGQKDMVTAVRAIYAELGVPEELILMGAAVLAVWYEQLIIGKASFSSPFRKG